MALLFGVYFFHIWQPSFFRLVSQISQSSSITLTRLYYFFTTSFRGRMYWLLRQTSAIFQPYLNQLLWAYWNCLQTSWAQREKENQGPLSCYIKFGRILANFNPVVGMVDNLRDIESSLRLHTQRKQKCSSTECFILLTQTNVISIMQGH